MSPEAPESSDFYIGYLEQGTRPRVAKLGDMRQVVAAPLPGASRRSRLTPDLPAMSPFSKSMFEFGVEREFEGVVCGPIPYPTLVVDRPGRGRGHVALPPLSPSGSSAPTRTIAEHVGRHGEADRLSLIYHDDAAR